MNRALLESGLLDQVELKRQIREGRETTGFEKIAARSWPPWRAICSNVRPT